VYRLQPRFPWTLLGRLAMILTILATVEAGLSSSGLCLLPKLGLLPTVTFAFGSPDATALPHTRQAGFWGKWWCRLRGNPASCQSSKSTDEANQVPPDLESQRRARLRNL
jgi:hypothetical protein